MKKRKKSSDTLTMRQQLGDLESLRLVARDPSDGSRTRSYREVVFNSLIHDIDMAMWLMSSDAGNDGELPEFVYASAPDSSSVIAVLKAPKSGRLAFLEYCDGIQYGYDQRLTAFGSKGVVYIHNPTVNQLSVSTSTGRSAAPIHGGYLSRYRDAYKRQLHYVCDVALAIHEDEEELLKWTKHMMKNKKLILAAISAGKKITNALETQSETTGAHKHVTSFPVVPSIAKEQCSLALCENGHIAKVPLKIALIGGGRMGQIRARSMKGIPLIEIKYIVDVNEDFAKTIAADFGAEGTSDLDKALSDPDVMGAWISTSTSTHFDMIKKAVEHGKPIYCEKPISDDRDVVRKCYEICSKSRCPLMCGWNRRFDPSISALVKNISLMPAPNMVFFQNGDNPLPPTHLLKSLGSMFHDLLVHDIDTLTGILKRKFPSRIFAAGSSFVSELKGTDVIDTAVLVLTYQDPNTVVYFHGRRRSEFGYDQQIEVVSLDGSSYATTNIANNSFVSTRSSGMNRGAKINYTFEDRFEVAHKLEVEAFEGMLIKGETWKRYNFNDELQQNWIVACICDYALESYKLKKELVFQE